MGTVSEFSWAQHPTSTTTRPQQQSFVMCSPEKKI